MAGLRERLGKGELTLAALISELRDPTVMTMFGAAGLDSVMIDMEHGMYGWADMGALIAVARGCGVAPLVRVPEIRREPVQKALDAGTAGVVAPMVDTAEQAAELVRLAKYPPWGDRGVALRRAHSDYAVITDPVGYMQRANDETAVMVQVETATSVANADALAAVDGVDALFVGPWDLSVSMGAPGRTMTDEARDAYRTVLDACARHGKAAAIHLTRTADARDLVEAGYTYVSLAADVSALIDQVAAGADAVRDTAPQEGLLG